MVEQLLPVVDMESNKCVHIKLIVFILIILILITVTKNLIIPGSLHCIDTKKLEISNILNIDGYANQLNLKDNSNSSIKENKKLIKENLMTADIVNMNYIDRKKEHKDIIGKYIEIRNNNRKEIPINKIIIMKDNRELVPLLNFTTQKTKTGVIYTYILPEPEIIRRIILDICIYNYFIENVKTSQVSVLDVNKNTIWKYNNIIDIDKRYYYIDISEPTIVYNRPHNLLCTNTDEECSQEKKLVISLAENTWQS